MKGFWGLRVGLWCIYSAVLFTPIFHKGEKVVIPKNLWKELYSVMNNANENIIYYNPSNIFARARLV